MSDRKKAFWFIALLSVLVVVPFLGETIFYSKGEPREAIVALSMLESGNWILPVNYGTDHASRTCFDWRCHRAGVAFHQDILRETAAFNPLYIGLCLLVYRECSLLLIALSAPNGRAVIC